MRSTMYFMFVFLLALCGGAKSYNVDEFARIDSVHPEPECSSAGGTCVFAEDCSGELTKQRGLCPKQSDKGVECCYGMSRRETRCQKLGGSCMSLDTFCNPRIVLTQASDCDNQKCCLLLK